jgi:amidase
MSRSSSWLATCAFAAVALMSTQAHAIPLKWFKPFHLEEATIPQLQLAIQTGQVSCQDVVEAYLARAKAYNGVCTKLVTADGAPIPEATGYTRAGSPLRYPTETVSVSGILPDLDKYSGLPIEYGRMESTATDPNVQQQYGFVTGIPNVHQLNALETINIRGERSQVCKGAFDAHPSTGPLPPDAPAACEAFRQMPDALERAKELDAKYGSKPDFGALPMYCVTIAVKDWYDTKDMRSTGGNDVVMGMDAAPDDARMVAELRDKGAIIYAVSVASQVTDTESGGPEANTKLFVPNTDAARASWGGTSCNAYDTERSPGFSSGGSGASVAANLVQCAICETTGGSCRIPANANGVASFVTTKGLISSDGGWTAQFINHRPGVLCRTLGDAAKVVDAMKDPETSTFDPADFLTAQPKPLVPPVPYAAFAANELTLYKPHGALNGVRIGVVREFMIAPSPNNVATNKLVDGEIKSVLRDQLKATIVESVDPLYPDDPTVPNMPYTFQDAFSEVMPLSIPEYFSQLLNGSPEFSVPGYDVTTKDYLVELSLLMAPLSANMNLRRLTTTSYDNTLRNQFMMDRYLTQRDDPLIKTWSDFVAHAKFFAESIRSGSVNAAVSNKQTMAPTSGIDRIKMHNTVRWIISKVMRQNHLDALVMTNIPAPPERNELARDPVVKDTRPNGPSITDLTGLPELIVPAGFNQIEYPGTYALSADGKTYSPVPGTVAVPMRNPMPISIMFWGGPGDEPILTKIATTYELASKRRAPPPDFPALPGEP